MKRRAILFDLDGTLTDPQVGITRCIGHALAVMEQPVPELSMLAWCIGPPLRQSFATLLDTRDPALIEAAVAAYRERFSSVGLFENEVYPGIPAVLSQLRGAGCQLLVATSKPAVFAERILERFELRHFFRVCCRGNPGRKP